MSIPTIFLYADVSMAAVNDDRQTATEKPLQSLDPDSVDAEREKLRRDGDYGLQ